MFNGICKLAMLLSTAVLILGVVLVWLLYPRSYDYKQVRRRCWGSRAALHCAMHVHVEEEEEMACYAGGGGKGPHASCCPWPSLPPWPPCVPLRLPPLLLQALSQTMFFFDTQREGYLPAGQPVAWRDNAYVADYNTTVNLASSLTNDTFGFGGVSEVEWVACWQTHCRCL